MAFDRDDAARMRRALNTLEESAQINAVDARQRHGEGWDDIDESVEMEQVRKQVAELRRRTAADLDLYVALGRQHLRSLITEMEG